MADIEKLILFESNNDNLRKAREPLHIMVIDDDPVTCQLIKNVFSDKYYVRTCTNLKEGLNDYLFLLPDIVFLDINLDDKDFNGLDMLDVITRHDPKAYVVMISSSGTYTNIARSWHGNAQEFLVKPFNSSKLKSCVHKCELSKRSEGAPWN